MDIPFSIRFLRKLELFQVVRKLNEQFDIQVKEYKGTVPLWEGEKKVLYWTYKWHKHLGSPIELDRLKEMDFSDREIQKLGQMQMFGNLVSRGYARFYPAFRYKEKRVLTENLVFPYDTVREYENEPADQESADGIVITADGLLVGELLNNLYKIGKLDETNFIQKKYNEISRATTFLQKKRPAWIWYNSLIYISYGALLIFLWWVLENLYKIFVSISSLN